MQDKQQQLVAIKIVLTPTVYRRLKKLIKPENCSVSIMVSDLISNEYYRQYPNAKRRKI